MWDDIEAFASMWQTLHDDWTRNNKKDQLLSLEKAVDYVTNCPTTISCAADNYTLQFIQESGKNDAELQKVLDDIENKKQVRYNKTSGKHYIEIRYERAWYSSIGVILKGGAKRHLFIKTKGIDDAEANAALAQCIVTGFKAIICHLHGLFKYIAKDYDNPHLFIPFPSFTSNYELKSEYYNSSSKLEEFYNTNKRPYEGCKRKRYNSNWLSSVKGVHDESSQMQDNDNGTYDEQKESADNEQQRNENENEVASESVSSNSMHNFNNYIEGFMKQGLDEAEAREMAKIKMKECEGIEISPEKKAPEPEKDWRLEFMLHHQPTMDDVDDW